MHFPTNKTTPPKSRPHRLWYEIAIALLIKAILLLLIWALFFSRPAANHMRMDSEQVSEHIVSSKAVQQTSTQPASNSK